MLLEIIKKMLSETFFTKTIDVHSRILIAEFPKYGIKYIDKLQPHCENMTFSDKSRYGMTFQQVTHKGGEFAIN